MLEPYDFYEGRVFRPPSEAYSLIVQSTIGCSHNGCRFCEMYREKRFRIRPLEDVLNDLRRARGFTAQAARIFFADGDAFIRRADEQAELLRQTRRIFPECERISMYASPGSILIKSDEELCALCAAGAELLYLGLESGDDALLQAVNKGATAEEIITAAKRAAAAGFQLSVTAISGLAGAEGSMAHAEATAEAVSAMKPAYFSLLTLMLEPGSEMYEDYRAGRFAPLSARAILEETRRFLERVDSEGTV
ncbi:MAG: radical SAM protein, partial [Clostridia bacterium]|nr:radical SAM protein [Clostridia bacterium]